MIGKICWTRSTSLYADGARYVVVPTSRISVPKARRPGLRRRVVHHAARRDLQRVPAAALAVHAPEGRADRRLPSNARDGDPSEEPGFTNVTTPCSRPRAYAQNLIPTCSGITSIRRRAATRSSRRHSRRPIKQEFVCAIDTRFFEPDKRADAFNGSRRGSARLLPLNGRAVSLRLCNPPRHAHLVDIALAAPRCSGRPAHACRTRRRRRGEVAVRDERTHAERAGGREGSAIGVARSTYPSAWRRFHRGPTNAHASHPCSFAEPRGAGARRGGRASSGRPEGAALRRESSRPRTERRGSSAARLE